jgi:hypothetical protein
MPPVPPVAVIEIIQFHREFLKNHGLNNFIFFQIFIINLQQIAFICQCLKNCILYNENFCSTMRTSVQKLRGSLFAVCCLPMGTADQGAGG